jgi:hypothetical protein
MEMKVMELNMIKTKIKKHQGLRIKDNKTRMEKKEITF